MAQKKRKLKRIKSSYGEFMYASDIKKNLGNNAQYTLEKIKECLQNKNYSDLDAVLETHPCHPLEDVDKYTSHPFSFDYAVGIKDANDKNKIQYHTVAIAAEFAKYLIRSFKAKNSFVELKKYTEWKEICNPAWDDYFKNDSRLDKSLPNQKYKGSSVLESFFKELTQRIGVKNEFYNPYHIDLNDNKNKYKFKNMDEALSWFEEGLVALKEAGINISYAHDFEVSMVLNRFKDPRFVETFIKNGGEVFPLLTEENEAVYYEEKNRLNSAQLGWQWAFVSNPEVIDVLKNSLNAGLRFKHFYAEAYSNYSASLFWNLCNKNDDSEENVREQVWSVLQEHDKNTQDSACWTLLNQIFSMDFVYDIFSNHIKDLKNKKFETEDEEKYKTLKEVVEIYDWLNQKAVEGGYYKIKGPLFYKRSLTGTGAGVGYLWPEITDNSEVYNYVRNFMLERQLKLSVKAASPQLKAKAPGLNRF